MVRRLGTETLLSKDTTFSADRAFARIAEGLVHYRSIGTSGSRPPIVLLHAAPGGSGGLLKLMQALHAADPGRLVLAPDMLGHGDSDPAAPDAPDIAYYAGSLLRVLDGLGHQRVCLYGTHTGARVACEAALLAPDRVLTVIFDGITDYDPAMRKLLLERYAPQMKPDEFGLQFVWAFHFVRDMWLHFPYFLRDAEHRLARDVPSAEMLHEAALDVLRGLTTYHKAYLAAFTYETRARLRLVEQRCLFLSASGELPNLQQSIAGFAALMPRAAVASVDGTPAETASAILRHIRAAC